MSEVQTSRIYVVLRLSVAAEQTSAERIALPLLQAPPDLSLVTMVTDAGCPTMHCSRPAPMASLWLATALKAKMKNRVKIRNALLQPQFRVFLHWYLVVTMVPRLWMDFRSPSVSITRSSWSFSSGWQGKPMRSSSPSLSTSSRSTWRFATHASPARASSVWVQVDVTLPSPLRRLSIWAWRT